MPHCQVSAFLIFFFFFNATATTEIYTLSLHDALPIQPASTTWDSPFLTAGTDGTHPLATYGVIIATLFGAIGLPHILVRFYTNPDGGAARRTTLIVVVLLSTFYLFPAV